MINKYTNLLLTVVIILSFFVVEKVSATHIVGGQLQYVKIGPGSMPNSSRYRIKLILYRDNNSPTFSLANEVPIICRADVRFNSDGSVKSAINETILGQRFGQTNVFIRDFTINDGSYLDTLTVRNGALVSNNNTGSNTFFNDNFDASINNDYGGAAGPTNSGDVTSSRLYPPSSIAGIFATLSGYEFGSMPSNYPANQIIASNNASASPQNFGFIRKYVYDNNTSIVDTCSEAKQFSLEIGEYIRVVDLPNVPGGWHLFFVLSARNAGIVNIERPLQSGYVVYTRIPDLAALDNAPNSYQLLNQAYAAEGIPTVLGVGDAFTFAGVGLGLIHNYLSTAPESSNRDIIARMQNSSPQFLSLPPTFVCQVTAILKNLGIVQNKQSQAYKAIDYDGDELEYELVPSKMARYDSPQSPWVNATERGFTGYWRGGTTLIDGTTFNNGDPLYPTMPLGPPSFAPYPTNPNIATFNNVIYRSPYTAESPIGVFSAPGIGTLPGFFIDKNTGDATFNPPTISQFVTNIRVREYRTIPGIGGGIASDRVLMSEISRDFQINVQQCPIRSEARIAFTQGCFRPNISPVPFTFAPLNSSIDPTNNLFWDFGIDRHTIIGSNLARVAPNGTIVSGSTIGGVSSISHIRFGVKTTTSAPNYTFTAPGTYFVKLVAQLESNNIERHNCSDSAFIAVNVSSIRSGYTVTGGPVCVNTPITFNPFATGTSTGFVTTSGASLWTNPATNPIPQVVLTTIDGVGNVTQSISEAWWMQPDGSRARIRPEEAQESKIVRVKYYFGKGQFIEFRRDKNSLAWTTIAGNSLATINSTNITGYFGPQSIPGVIFSYPDSIANAQSYLLVENQFGQTPTAQIYTNNVCQNVSTVQVSGFITIAPRGIWSGGNGNYIQASGTTTPRATVIGVSSVVGGITGRFLSFTYQPTIAELSVAGFSIPMVLSTSGISECPVGISTSAGITVTPRPFVDAGPPSVLLCRNNLEYVLNGTISGSATEGRWSTLNNGGTFLGSNMNTSTLLGEVYRFSSSDVARGFAILTLTSTNHGLNGCLPVRDVITLTAGPLLDVPTIAGFTVNGVSTTPYTIFSNNNNFTIVGIVSNSGLGGIWSRTSTSTGAGGVFSNFTNTTLPGNNVNIVSVVYSLSPADTSNGFVDLELSTNVLPSPTQCINVRKVVRIVISPSFNILITSTNTVSGLQACTNNAEFTISGTVLGAGGFSISDSGLDGTFTQLSTSSGSDFFVSSYIYKPSASILGLAESMAGEVNIPISFVSTGNGSYSSSSTTRNLSFIRSPRAIIYNAVSDTFMVCKNNANVIFSSTVLTGPTTLLWSTNGTGSFTPEAGINTLYTSSPTDTTAGTIMAILRASNAANGCKPTYDTAYVKYISEPKPVIISQSDDIVKCPSELALLKVTASGENLYYRWNSGQAEREIQVSDGGIYLVTVSNRCMNTVSDTMIISNKPETEIISHPQSAEICEGNSSVISVSATGENISYAWDNGLQTPSFITTIGGDYMVTVTGTCGVKVSNIARIDVLDKTLPLLLPLSTTLCGVQSYTFNVSAMGVNNIYSWDNGTFSNSLTTSIPGTYFVTVVGTCGSFSTSASLAIIENTDFPSLESYEICQGNTHNFSVFATGDNLKYLWNNGAQTSYITTSVAGSYQVTVSGTCGTKVSNEVTLNVLEETSPTYLPESVTICGGQFHTFTVSATGVSHRYYWEGNSYSSSYTTSTPGTYFVTVAGACSSFTASASLFSVDSTRIISHPISSEICEGNSSVISVSATGENISYAWDNGLQTPSFITTIGGDYIVTVTGTCGVKVSNIATLNILPITKITEQPISNTICGENAYSFLVSADGNDLQYIWNNGATTRSISATTTGIYVCTVSGKCGLEVSNEGRLLKYANTEIISQPVGATICGGSHSLSVSALGENLTYVWNNGMTGPQIIVSIPGDYFVTASGTCGSEKSLMAQIVENCGEPSKLKNTNDVTEISVYPNPSHGSIKVYNQTSSATKFVVKDVFGREVLSGNLSVGENDITIENSKGIYFLITSYGVLKIVIE